jgi:protein-tyrosine phosphatase
MARWILLPDGAEIAGRGLRYPSPAGPIPEYGLYLGSSRLRGRHDFSWPHDRIDWPDFLLPRDRDLAIRLIHGLHDRISSGERAEVACGGGVGRTGTVISCLAVLSGLDPVAAIAWTRANYHRRAVETPWQRRWVAGFR